MTFVKQPIAKSLLERFRLDAHRQLRRHLVGGHITRRMGQSLEFHEFASYNPGDDTRHIDWRASARQVTKITLTPWDGLIVRRFAAEEHYKILISIDARPTMTWPYPPTNESHASVNMSKLQVARWIAEALTFVALREQNQVTFHQLFGNPLEPRKIKSMSEDYIRLDLDRITLNPVTHEQFNNRQLEHYLPPTAAWIIITDFYYNQQNHVQTQRLLQQIKAARNGMCWIILVDLNSWDYERLLLEKGARLIFGPYMQPKEVSGKKIMVDERLLEEVKQAINKTKQQFYDIADHTVWEWPADRLLYQQFAGFFQKQFLQDKLFGRLFKRDV